MTSTSEKSVYAVYLTEKTNTQAAGTVVNRIVWDGTSTLAFPPGQASVLDVSGKYPIGSVYTEIST